MTQQRRRKSQPERPATTVLKAWTCPGWVDHRFMTSTLHTMAAAPSYGIDLTFLPWWSGPHISVARCQMVDTFLRGTADWMLQVDTDMTFEADAVPRLLEAADPVKKPIVSGLCFGVDAERGVIKPEADVFLEDGVYMPIPEWPEDAVMEVDAVGAGFLLVHRGVFTCMAERYPRPLVWFEETVVNGVPYAEDIEFCRRACALGIPIYVHTGVRIGHAKRFYVGDPNGQRL